MSIPCQVVSSSQDRNVHSFGWAWIVIVISLVLMCVTALTKQWSATEAYQDDQSVQAASLSAKAYLYRFDPVSQVFVTITLPDNSRPADVQVVSDGPSYHIWFSEPGLRRIGRVVYTSSVDYTITEFEISGAPASLAASTTQVWFTLPEQNSIGWLDIADGTVMTLELPIPNADPVDIALDVNERAWVTERMANRLAQIVISPTVAITEYELGATSQGPEGVLAAQDGSVWVSAGASSFLWQLDPSTGEYSSALALGTDSLPFRLIQDHSGDLWTTLYRTNQVAHIELEAPAVATLYTIPTPDSRPAAIGANSLGQVFFAEQATARIGRLVTTPTVAFAEHALPHAGLKLTGLTIAEDDAVWAVAHLEIHRSYLPVVMRNYNSTPPPFSIQMYGAITATTGFTRMLETGARRVRFPASWYLIEPVNSSPAEYDWENLDTSVQAATDAQVQLILTIADNPAWAAKNHRGPVNNLADLQEFVGALVARYPQVLMWEFYNEPDYINGFGKNGAAYAAMLQAVYPVVKAANSNAQVVMGGLALDWFIEDGGVFDKNFLADVASNCQGPCFDIANFHYYPFFRSTWEAYGRDIIGKANYVRQVIAAHGYDRPVINTETGWPAGTIWGNPELQARYVIKTNVRGEAAGLGLVNWFSLTDADSSDPGLVGPGLTPRPAHTAFKTLVSVLGQARYTRVISWTETGSPNLEGYEFFALTGGAPKRIDVYWYDCPSMSVNATDCSTTAPLQISAVRVAVIDKLGTTVILNDADDGLADGKVNIPGVGSSPIFVDYRP